MGSGAAPMSGAGKRTGRRIANDAVEGRMLDLDVALSDAERRAEDAVARVGCGCVCHLPGVTASHVVACCGFGRRLDDLLGGVHEVKLPEEAFDDD